jgi:hypothetical protein
MRRGGPVRRLRVFYAEEDLYFNSSSEEQISEN